MSGLDAAAKILAEAGEPLDCRTIVERAFAQKLWSSDGKTPGATIYSAILREIAKKGDASRFTSVYQEYARAPLVTRKRLYLEAMNDVALFLISHYSIMANYFPYLILA